MLDIADLHAGYGRVTVLNGVSLTARPREVTALLGANGAGKTTLMRSIAGVLPSSSGRVRAGGTDITDLPANQRVERGIALVPEGRLVFSNLSVAQNLQLGSVTHRARHRRAARTEEMYALFPRLAERSRQIAGTLSGGEQQMLAIGRALMSYPEILLLDEPTLGLAPRMCDLIFQTITELTAGGLTIVLAEQNVPRTLAISQTAYVIEHGRISISGEARSLIDDPRVRSAYMGV
jgi:branched-chain amino acid transport system ATP-binding protein